MNIDFNVYQRPESSHIYIAHPNEHKICCLNGIDEETCQLEIKANNASKISFTVNRYIDGEETNGYEYLHRFMRLYVERIGWFILQEPTVKNDGLKETKEITAESIDIEFMQNDLTNFSINCGTTDSREMLVEDNVTKIEDVEFALEQIRFYYPSKPKLSLLNILLEDYPDWTIEYVDDTPKQYENIVLAADIKDSIKSLQLSLSQVDTTSTTGQALAKQYNDQIASYQAILDAHPNDTLITYYESRTLANEIGKFEIDNESQYTFMTQDLPQYFECILYFDIDKHTVSAYRVENIGKNTSILISFRNVENDNTVEVDENSVYTTYTVQGADDLGITYVNFGSNKIENLDYYLNTKYMPQTLITKYKEWLSDVDTKRSDYIQLSKKYNAQLDVISELYNRVPLDGCSTKWSTFSDDDLKNAKDSYTAQIAGYQAYYIKIDSNGNKVFDQAALDASVDKNDYYQIKDVILPSIQIEYDNRKLPTSVGEKDYIDSYKTNWALYGVDELAVKIKEYQDTIDTLKENHYDLPYDTYITYTDPTSSTYDSTYGAHTKDMHDSMYKKYSDAVSQLDGTNTNSCQAAYTTRKNEAATAEATRDTYSNDRTNLTESLDKDNWVSSTSGAKFTQDELQILRKLYSNTDYENKNILITSTNTTDEVVDTQLQLLKSAQDDLVSYAQPQFKYSTTLDNLLALNEYADWSEQLSPFAFIWLGVRDDCVVKLRVTGITFNPMLMDNNLKLEFSNMIVGKSKRNDFINLLNISENVSKNSIKTSYQSSNSNDDATVTLTTGLLQKILSSSAFNSKVNEMVSGTVGSFGTVTTGTLTADMIKASNANIENGYFQYLRSELISAGNIVADDASFQTVQAKLAAVDNLLAGTVSASLGHIIQLTANNVNISEAVIRDLIAAQITVSMLHAGTISADKFNIASDDGGMSIVGNTMQFKDASGVVRIQIGRDTNDNFTFCLYDATGTGVLIDSTGIKQSAISDGLINNDMIATNTISKDRLNFNTVDANADGTVNASKVIVNGQGVDAEFTTVKQSIEDNIAWTLKISSTQGLGITNGKTSTTLTPILYHGNADVTGDWMDSNFVWSRRSCDTYGDTYWNDQHEAGTKSLTITNVDIANCPGKVADFVCSFIVDNTVVTTSA